MRNMALVAIMAALALAPVGCGKEQGSAPDKDKTDKTQEAAKKKEEAKKPVRIAVIGPMTGQYATFGNQMAEGAKQAVADLNAVGGVLGRPIELEIGDDACDPKQAVAVANQMVQKGVVFVAGHWCSGSSIPASKVYDEEGVIMMSPGSTNPKLTDEGGDSIFRVCGRDDQQGVVAGQFIAQIFPTKKIAVLHDKTAYGKGLADEVKKAIEKAGKKVVLYEAYTAGEKDYTAVVSKLKQNGIEALFVGGYHTEAGLIARQMKEQKMKTVLISGDSLVTEEFWSITGDAGEGTLMTFSPDPRKNPKASKVVKVFRGKDVEPEGYVLYTYGAVQTWAEAVKQADKIDLNANIKSLRAGQFETVLGKISFNDKGDVNAKGYVMYEWSKGKYDYYDFGKITQ